MKRFWLYTASLIALVAVTTFVTPTFAKNGHGGGGNGANRGNSHSSNGNFNHVLSNVKNNASSGQATSGGSIKKTTQPFKNAGQVFGNANVPNNVHVNSHGKDIQVLTNNQLTRPKKTVKTASALGPYNPNHPKQPLQIVGNTGVKSPLKPTFQASPQSTLHQWTSTPSCPPPLHPKPHHPCPPQFPCSTNNSCWNPWFALGGFGPGIGIFNNGGGYGGAGPIVIEQPVIVETPVVVERPDGPMPPPDAPTAPPAQVPVGMLIQLNGPGFGAAEGRVGLECGDLQLAVAVPQWSDEKLTIGVPPMALIRPTPAKLFVFRNDGSVAMELPCVLVMPPPPQGPQQGLPQSPQEETSPDEMSPSEDAQSEDSPSQP